MKAFLVAAIVMLGAGFAQAYEGSTFDPNATAGGSAISTPAPDNHEYHICTTKSRDKLYQSKASDLHDAKNAVVKACLDDGGKTSECHHNIACTVGTENPPGTPSGSYYDWGRGMNGYGYCYQFAANGKVMNNGRPQPYAGCERVHRSFYDWGQYQGNPSWYCFQWTPYGDVLNEGRAMPLRLCQH